MNNVCIYVNPLYKCDQYGCLNSSIMTIKIWISIGALILDSFFDFQFIMRLERENSDLYIPR